MEGIKNNIFKSQHVEEIKEEREKICFSNQCGQLDTEGKKCAVPGTGPCCGDCGCSLALKLRSLSSECPKGWWDAELTLEEEYYLKKKIEDEP